MTQTQTGLLKEMKRNVKKLWNGCISLRSFDVDEAIAKKEPMIVRFQGEEMWLSPHELKTKIKAKSKPFTSKWGRREYQLYDYEWKPTFPKLL